MDVVIIGAGAAGLMCAIEAAKLGKQVQVLEHASKLGGKILISGGGRCNFTNTGASSDQYVSANPHFSKSALSRYPAARFIELVKTHGIPFHEKKLGQLFCDGSAQSIVDMLENEAKQAGVRIGLGRSILGITRRKLPQKKDTFHIETSQGTIESHALVIATGGLSLPKLGATAFGYDVARQFQIACTGLDPALDGFVFGEHEMKSFGGLSGVSIDVIATTQDGHSFRENILFTHTGLSGPASLQASLHWHPGEAVEINLVPGIQLAEMLMSKKKSGAQTLVKNVLSEFLPSRFAEKFCSSRIPSIDGTLTMQEMTDAGLTRLAHDAHAWRWIPSRTVGYSKAEVTRGGVDTNELSSKTMESKKVPGLYFVGEVVDVTGWLGGYNFQWAWASGWAAGQAIGQGT